MVTEISEERQKQSIKAGKRVKRQADINPKWEKQSRVSSPKHNDQTEKDENAQKYQPEQYKTLR